MEKIGIVGLGFVGGAIKYSFDERTYNINLVLVDPAKGFYNTIDDLKDCTGVFIAVPSPQGDDGKFTINIIMFGIGRR